MSSKKGSQKEAKIEKPATEAAESFGTIANKADLKKFLQDVRDKMADGSAPPVYALTAMNYVLNLQDIYSLLSDQSKELARDIWLRLRQSGVKLKNPPLLFDPTEDTAVTQS